ncbi:nuclear transport factor 2 family protein [Trujillonella humicola]|uniref:nuclear transport factor 2 family protein n=1 Tax=Trujillonella humicola TaxID=3383699 RepID=UPI003905765B
MPDPGLAPGDVLAVHQLLALYGHHLDDGEFGALAEIFTADATVVFAGRDRPPIEGIDAIVAFFATAAGSSAHHVCDVVVSGGPGEVRVRSSLAVPYTRPEHDAHRWHGGTYDDVVVRTGAGWRIHRRTITGRWQLTTDARPVPQHRRTS